MDDLLDDLFIMLRLSTVLEKVNIKMILLGRMRLNTAKTKSLSEYGDKPKFRSIFD